MARSCETIALLLDGQTGQSTSGAALSSQLLYKFLHNNLRVGQWELAKACIETLVQQDCDNEQAFVELLKSIVEEPLLYSNGSHSVTTPFHLSWLASLEFLKHFKGKSELPQSLQKKMEFWLLLQSCNKDYIPLDCLQELDDYHSEIVHGNKSSILEPVPDVSVSWVNPLKSLIENQPRYADAIIHTLVVPDSRFATNNLFFYNLYLELLKEQLNELGKIQNTIKQMAHLGEVDKNDEGLIREHNTCCKSVHELLTSMDLLSVTAQSEIDEVLINVLYKVQNNPFGNFTKGSIYSALLSHSSLVLFKRFCDMETEYQLGNSFKSLSEVSSSPKFFVPSENLLTRTWDKDRRNAWMLLYLYARQDHHILEDVVTTCVEFAQQGELEKVIKILSCKEFSPLKVLVLLLAWPYCHTCDSAQTLLNSLWDTKSSSKHVLLDQACMKLEYQLHLVKWCLDKTKPLVAASNSSSTEERQKVYEMFQSLDSHSVLHVLHQSTNLAQLPKSEVLGMLKTRPVFSSERRLESQEETPSDIDDRISSDSEIQRDIALYHAFCAMRGFVEMTLAGRDNNLENDFTFNMKESRHHVDNIYPLTFRVEVLENIFSMLFVSSDQLLEEVLVSYETDDIESLDSRSLRSSRTASFESFLSVDSRTTSPWRSARNPEQSSASRPISPESSNKLDGERWKHSPSMIDKDPKIAKGSPDLRQVSKPSPEDSTMRSVRARELNFDDVDFEPDEVNEVYPLRSVGSNERILDGNELNRKGLLMSRTMVCQFLDLLKECLNEVIQLKTQSSGHDDIYADWMKTSVSLATLDQRISRLGQYINEAQWRHQLVSTCCNIDEFEDDFVEDQSSFFSDDSDIDLDIGKTEEKLVRPLAKAPSKEAGIPRLLSSPSSLIYMCMKKDSYAQAKHIIKLFNIEEDESSKSVHFAEEYEKSFRKLTQAEKTKTKERASKAPEKKGRHSVLKNVASVAAAVIASISTTSIVEELLLSAGIDLSSCGFTLTEPAHAHFLHALVCFDLMCTGQIRKVSCKNFVEMAKKKMDIAMDIEPLTPYTLQRVSEMVNTFETLLNDINGQGGLDSRFSDIKPLNAKSVKIEQDLQTHQENAFIKLEAAIDDGDNVIKSVDETSTTELSAVLKLKKIEHKTAVRVAMVDFHYAFDCGRDERLLSLDRSRWLAKHRLDYVQSLYNHVNMLSTWELYWKLSSRERNELSGSSQRSIALKATNPFVVLTQGFDDIAGKPLFERNVPPRKMESMCRKMNVNLIRIIVHNCCPVVPAFSLQQHQDSLLSSASKVVLNESCDPEMTSVDDPILFSEMLVTKTKELLEVMKDPESGIVDAQSLLVLSTSPSYALLLKELRKLSSIDLGTLLTDEDKMCFFTNVLNTLLSHAAITEVAKCSSKKNRSSHHLDTEDQTSGDKSRQQGLPRLEFSYCRTSYLKKYGYYIGKLGFVSAFDLWFTILRAGLPIPSNIYNRPSFSRMSYHYQRYQPKTSDFRLTFVICDGTISAPEIQALNKLNVQTQLDNAMSSYLSSTVEIVEDEKIYLPEIMKWFEKDFVPSLSASIEKSDSIDTKNWVELLLRISPYLQGEHFSNLDNIATQLDITFTPHSWLFGFQFRSVERTLRRETSFKSYATTAPKYTLTQSLSSYLMAGSPLVASLANLSCSQDSNLAAEESQTKDDFPLLTVSVANPGTRGLEVASPFEFALNQAVKFPVLQRSITSSFPSVCKFLYLDGLGLTKPSKASLARNQSRLFLLDEKSKEISEMFLRAVDYAWRKVDWNLLLDIFNSPSLNQHGDLHGPEDFFLEMAFMSGVEECADDDLAVETARTLRNFNIPAPNFDLNWKEEKWLLLCRIKDNCARAKIVLQCLHNWTNIEVCLKLLKFCLSKPPDDSDLLASLEKKTKQLHLCKKIMDCHSSQEFSDSSIQCKSWKDVVEHSVRSPKLMLQALQDRERFDLVREWIDVYGYPSQLREGIHEDYLGYLLTKSPIDVTEVYMYLDEIEDPVKTLEICEELLSGQMPIANTIFIIQFIITDLHAYLKPDRKRELFRQRLGANAVLCIPEGSRRPYEYLTSQPLLLLEQLLIDMKVEWAGKVFDDLQNELNTNAYDEVLRKEVSVEAFDKLLEWYATKALEFEVVTYNEQDDLADDSKSEYSKSVDSRQLKTSTPIKVHQRHGSTGTKRSFRSGSIDQQKSESFRIPDKIPAEEDWEPDYKHSVCMICKEVVFNMFVRRHHCRRCGRVVCDTCSPFKRVLPNSARTPVRVCKDCDKAMFEQSYRLKEGGSPIPSDSSSTPMSTSLEGRANAEFRERLNSAVLKDDFNFDGHHACKLSLDEELNVQIRSDFLYEQAPSSSLCTSILALHGNSKTCGELLLELCNKLSQKLGMSEEIDNNLLISIICQLLYHAKLKFTNCGETHGVELCDTYMSRVELVKFLIESNFYEVPSIEDLMSSQTARRLRDKLIENESLSLAMEVTTKCGLDPGAVWGAWGLAYLQIGKFKEAREKFSKFLKPSERGKTTHGNIRYLKTIIDILETSPMVSFDYLTVGDLSASLTSLREHAKNSNGTRIMDPKRFEECVFYLNTYGSYAGMVTFYVNHNYLKLACRFILEKRCPPDVFTDNLLMTAIRHGQFENLRDLLKMFDPSLDVWMPHLNGACRHLSRSNSLHVLYQVQLLMKDYFRAAMTCIKFYQGLPHQPATTYADLYSRLNYLKDALDHLEAVRKQQSSMKGTLAMVSSSLQKTMAESSEDKSRINVTTTELSTYKNTITLQIDVTKFMHNCVVEGSLREEKDEKRKLGSLFDNATIKCDVVSKVLLAGNTVDDGFSLSCRIIQDFRLPVLNVYKVVAQKLASKQKFNEVKVLLSNAIQTRLMNERDHDAVLLDLLGLLTDDDRKWKQAEALIKSLKDEGRKVAAYIRFRRLKTAYLIAVENNRVDDVKAIANMARETEQTKVYNICMKWLETKREKTEKQDVLAEKD